MLYPPAVAAYGALTGRAPWPELRLLAVAPEARGLGVGRALVDECARRARRLGADALGLHTSRSMRAAVRLYERLGFVREPGHDFQPPGAELVTAYVLRLDREGAA
jgi:ribosomal protein S18 acetylase RimI-like enzyme